MRIGANIRHFSNRNKSPITRPMRNKNLFLVAVALFFTATIIFFRGRSSVLVVSDQFIDTAVHIDRVTFRRGGYVVVTGIRYAAAEGVDYLVSEYLRPGVHNNVNINFIIEKPQKKGDFFQPIEPIQPEGYLVAQLYEQTGAFISETATPVKDFFGNPVLKQFRVTLKRDPYRIKRACDQFTEKVLREACLTQGIEKHAKDSGFIIDICAIVDSGDKEHCYRQMGRTFLSEIKEKDIRFATCERTVLNQYVQWCEYPNK